MAAKHLEVPDRGQKSGMARIGDMIIARGPVVIAGIVAVVFANTLFNDFVWDDLRLIVPNEAYQRFDVIRILSSKANDLEYLPVKDLSFALDASLWGMRPFGFHLTNLLLYLATTFVVFRTVRTIAPLTGVVRIQELAFWTTLFFMLHPLHMEAVAFITARNTLLAFLFAMLSCSALVRGLAEDRPWFVRASVLLFVLAIFSKASMVFFPLFAAFMLYGLHWPAITNTRKALIAFAFFVVGAVGASMHVYNARDAAVMNEQVIRFGLNSGKFLIAKAMEIHIFYLKMMAVPYPLSVDYPDSLADGRGVWMTLLSTAVLIVVAAGAWAYRKKHPFVLFGLLWSYLSLVPVLNLFPTIPVVADRYAYPVILGFAMMLAYGLTRLQDRRTGAAGLMAAGAVLLLWSAVNLTRSYDWRTEEALFRSSLGSYKGASGVNYALALWSNGRYEQALDVLRAEHARTGDYRYSQYQGKLLKMSGKIAEAIPLFERSLREGGDAWRRPHYDLALAYEQAGMHGPALAHFLKTVETRNADMFGSELRSAHEGIERVRSVYQAQLAEGRRRALEQPGGFAAQASYAYLLQTVGLYDEAVVFYRRAIELDRGRWEPWYNMGLAYMRSRQYRDAIQAFQRSLGIKPDNKEALNNSGTCFAALADYGNAEQHFRKALTVDPVFEYAAYNLARLYFAEGKADEAKKMLGHLSRISPGNAEMQARLQQYRRMLE